MHEKAADIVICEEGDPDTAYIIVELKKPKRRDGLEQLKSYCNAEGSPIGGWRAAEEVGEKTWAASLRARRFTRLTNAFSKKLANLKAHVALHFAYYNFARIHQTLRVTPAMAAGITDHLWNLGELLA